AARGQDAEASSVIADEVAEPANDLFLDEGPDRPGVPDVDALLGHLRQDLARDGRDERRRREVAEGPRVIGAERVGCEALGPFAEDGIERRGLTRGGSRSAAR